jgi:hypothetical protein
MLELGLATSATAVDGKWSAMSISPTIASLSLLEAVFKSERKVSNVAILDSRVATYSRETGARFESSSRYSHLRPATAHLRHGEVREHLICDCQLDLNISLRVKLNNMPCGFDNVCSFHHLSAVPESRWGKGVKELTTSFFHLADAYHTT